MCYSLEKKCNSISQVNNLITLYISVTFPLYYLCFLKHILRVYLDVLGKLFLDNRFLNSDSTTTVKPTAEMGFFIFNNSSLVRYKTVTVKERNSVNKVESCCPVARCQLSAHVSIVNIFFSPIYLLIRLICPYYPCFV